MSRDHSPATGYPVRYYPPKPRGVLDDYVEKRQSIISDSSAKTPEDHALWGDPISNFLDHELRRERDRRNGKRVIETFGELRARQAA